MSDDLQSLFGECRAWFEGEDSDAEELLAILELAHQEDSERFEQEWLPYLKRARLPEMSSCTLYVYRAFTRILPASMLPNLERIGHEEQMHPAVAEHFPALRRHLSNISDQGAGAFVACLQAMADTHPPHYEAFVRPWLAEQTLLDLRLSSLEDLVRACVLLPESSDFILDITREGEHPDPPWISNETLQEMCEHKELRRVSHLCLRGHHFGAAEMETLTRCKNLSKVHTLNLSHNTISDVGVALLAHAKTLPELDTVDLSYNCVQRLEPELVVRLCSWQMCSLYGNPFLPWEAECWVMAFPDQIQLERLNLTLPPISKTWDYMSCEAFKALLQTYPVPITHLKLNSNSEHRWGDEHMYILANEVGVQSLAELEIHVSFVSDAGIHALTRSSNLPRLVSIRALHSWSIQGFMPDLKNVLGQPVELEWGS